VRVLRVKAIAFVLVLLLILLQFLPFAASLPGTGEAPYSEKIEVFIVGRTVYYRVVLSGGNISLPMLEEAEKVEGVRGYTLHVTKILRWEPEFYYFSEVGFGFFAHKPVSEGAFLMVNSTSVEDAKRFARALGNVTKLSFMLVEEGEGTFTFFSPCVFARILYEYLWAFPQVQGGFVDVVSAEDLDRSLFSEYTLSGVKEGGRFFRTLSLGLVERDVYVKGTFPLFDLFDEKFRTSDASVSSTLRVVTKGSLIIYTDFGNLTVNTRDFSSEVRAELRRGDVVPLPNLTLMLDYPVVLVMREVDRTSIKRGETLEVRMRFRNIGGVVAKNVTVKEDWWKGLFELLTPPGSAEFTIDRLAAKENASRVYRLRLVSEKVGDLEVPASTITYCAVYGPEVARFSTHFNSLLLRLNKRGPSLVTIADTPHGPATVGDHVLVLLRVVNIGEESALEVETAFGKRDVLIPGESWTLTANVPVVAFDQIYESWSWPISWVENGVRISLITNSINSYRSYERTAAPLMDLRKKIAPYVKNGEIFANVTLVLSNHGRVDAERILVRDTVPAPMRFISGNVTVVDGAIEEVVDRVEAFGVINLFYILKVEGEAENYVFPFASIEWEIGGKVFKLTSNSAGVPLGVAATLSFTPEDGFPGMNATARLSFSNRGLYDVYGVTLLLSVDERILRIVGESRHLIDCVKFGERIEREAVLAIVRPGAGSGNVTVTFLFAGELHEVSGQATLRVSEKPELRLKIVGDPMEKREFVLSVSLRNRANVAIENVTINLTIRPEPALLNGSLVITIERLEALEERVVDLSIRYDFPLICRVEASASFIYLNISIPMPEASLQVGVAEDVLYRYLLPVSIGLALVTATSLLAQRRSREVRRKVAQRSSP